jgi:hypothetical protein
MPVKATLNRYYLVIPAKTRPNAEVSRHGSSGDPSCWLRPPAGGIEAWNAAGQALGL